MNYNSANQINKVSLIQVTPNIEKSTEIYNCEIPVVTSNIVQINSNIPVKRHNFKRLKLNTLDLLSKDIVNANKCEFTAYEEVKSKKGTINENYLNTHCKIKFKFCYLNFQKYKHDTSIYEIPLRLIKVKMCICWEDYSKNPESADRYIIKYKINDIYQLSQSVKITHKVQEDLYKLKPQTLHPRNLTLNPNRKDENRSHIELMLNQYYTRNHSNHKDEKDKEKDKDHPDLRVKKEPEPTSGRKNVKAPHSFGNLNSFMVNNNRKNNPVHRSVDFNSKEIYLPIISKSLQTFEKDKQAWLKDKEPLLKNNSLSQDSTDTQVIRNHKEKLINYIKSHSREGKNKEKEKQLGKDKEKSKVEFEVIQERDDNAQDSSVLEPEIANTTPVQTERERESEEKPFNGSPEKSPDKRNAKMAQFLKSSISSKINSKSTFILKKEEEPVVKKPLTEYLLKKIMVSNFEFEPRYDCNEEYEAAFKEKQQRMVNANQWKRRSYVISNKFAFLASEFAARGWRDVKEEVEEAIDNEEDQYEFDFSLYYFNPEQKGSIRAQQILSNFSGMHICSKIGMHNTLRTARKQYLMEVDWFFPKCFDLNDKYDILKFIDYFLANECLKVVLNAFQVMDLDSEHVYSTTEFQHIVEKAHYNLFEKPINYNFLEYCSGIVDKFLLKNQQLTDQYVIFRILVAFGVTMEIDAQFYRAIEIFRKGDKSKYQSTLDFLLQDETYEVCINAVKGMLNTVSTYKCRPLLSLNEGYNKWIVKAYNNSRGVGISVHSNLKSVLDLRFNRKTKYVAQKYIENNLLYNQRKFDVRIWTIVTSSAPLVSWIYSRFYVRLSAKNFDINDNDRFVNLTNYAVQKNCTDRYDECMLTYEEFKEFIIFEFSEQKWEELLLSMYTIIATATVAGHDKVERRMNTFIILGWDLMVDSFGKAYLIECNRGPDLSASTSITKDLTEAMFKDLAKLFCDYNYRDINSNDNLSWIGHFFKFINNSVYKEFLKYMNPDIKKKEKINSDKEIFK